MDPVLKEIRINTNLSLQNLGVQMAAREEKEELQTSLKRGRSERILNFLFYSGRKIRKRKQCGE